MQSQILSMQTDLIWVFVAHINNDTKNLFLKGKNDFSDI